MNNVFNVKIFYGRKGKLIRYCQIDDYTDFSEFKESIVRVFPQLKGSRWKMYWFDDEDDKIMITDETSHDCFQDSEEIKKKVYVERIRRKRLRRYRRKSKKSTIASSQSRSSNQKFVIPNCTRCEMEKSPDFRGMMNDFSQSINAYSQKFVKMLEKLNITEKDSASNTANQSKSDATDCPKITTEEIENYPEVLIDDVVDKNSSKEVSERDSQTDSNAVNESATTQQEEEDKTSIELKVKYIYHIKPHIENAVIAMSAMGYNNEGNWLTPLLESVDGNVPKALDRLKPKN